DLREHEMAERADLFMHPNPGTDLVWLSAVSRYLLENGFADHAFLEKWAVGITQPTMGSDSSTAISNLLLLTGNYMRPGAGAYPLRGHNNVQGASDHGAMPNFLSGYQSVDDPEVRSRFETGWKVKLPSTKGLDNHQMVEAIYEGKLKSIYLIGE